MYLFIFWLHRIFLTCCIMLIFQVLVRKSCLETLDEFISLKCASVYVIVPFQSASKLSFPFQYLLRSNATDQVFSHHLVRSENSNGLPKDIQNIYIYIKYPLVYNSSRKPQNSSLQMKGDVDSKQPNCLNCALYIVFYWRALVCLTYSFAK